MKGWASQPTILINTFPPQQQQMFEKTLAALIRGNVGHFQHGGESSTMNIMMVKYLVALSTLVKNYDTLVGEPYFKDPPSTSQPSGFLTL